MDAENYSQSRYDEIIKNVTAYCYQIGFKKDSVFTLPISGWEGDNLIEKSSKTTWYNGPCLIDTIDKIDPP